MSEQQREVEREQRELMCKLTEGEIIARGDEMAKAELEIDRLKETRRGVNGQIADLSTRRNKLATIIEEGEEARAVDCTWIEDFAKNVVRLVRQDTGAEVDTRPMTADDRQESLGLEAVDDVTGEVVQVADSDAPPQPAPRPKSKKHSKKNGKAKARGNTRHAHA